MVGSKTSRARRKSGPGAEQVKHRRTRSGCFTCRTRRVKCDEIHPICDRCRKGGRDCVYPASGPSSNNLRADDGHHSNREGSSSLEGESDDGVEDQIEALPEEFELVGGAQDLGTVSRSAKREASSHSTSKNQSPSRRRRLNRMVLESSPLTEKSPSPSVESSIAFSGSYLGSPSSRTMRNTPLNSPISEMGGDSGTDWSHLHGELQFYLAYHRNSLTLHHYFMIHDAQDFLRTTFLDMAVKDEPLLYAVVAFSAFHHTIAHPNGRIQTFLAYYDKSVSLLRISLQKSRRHTASTLLTILQLATFEEYLGDWDNLLIHQKAACETLAELYDPHSIMQSSMRRVIFYWCSRFDIFASLLSGRETMLGREWYLACQQHHLEQTERCQVDINHKIAEAIANLRFIAMDMSVLFAKRVRKSICHDEFANESDTLARRISEWRSNMHPSLRDQACAITLDGPPGSDSDSIVDAHAPGILFESPLWPMNFALLGWYALDLAHRHQTALVLQRQPPVEAERMALEACQLIEAIECYPEAPPGAALVATHTSLAVASLFLLKDDRHIAWARRKFARIEQLGYIYPASFRIKISEMWNIPDIKHDWLPDGEGHSEVIRSIRSSVDDRDRTMLAGGVPSQDIIDMKAIFGSMRLEEGQSEPSPASGQSSAGFSDNAAAGRVFGDKDISKSQAY
ncbi:MAG: hypothetical protein M1813_002511 [Trichoglossum hirsutum]|nr:MAG: hypothetical protein M1813_002511 [Trichoglossum hirsutum]